VRREAVAYTTTDIIRLIDSMAESMAAMPKVQLTEQEHLRRIAAVRTKMEQAGMDALYLVSRPSIFYLTGYSYISTERPLAIVVPLDGKVTFMGPLLEKGHIPLRTRLTPRIRTYLDYPGRKHPMEHFARFLKDMKLHTKVIGIDVPAGALSEWGYKGPRISEILSRAKFVEAHDIIPAMRVVKSPEEIDLIIESAKWANLALTLLQEHVKPGEWDVEVAAKASLEASSLMKKTLGPGFEPQVSGLPAAVGFRGQVGPKSAVPHSISTAKPIERGDVLVAESGPNVGGYFSELERTMIVGSPTAKQRKYFEIMLEAQDAALEAFKPGARCREVDMAANRVLRARGCRPFIRHHTGHGLGLEEHEPPWLDIGDRTVVRPGMVFSCEPGVYIPGLGGFRHSDAVLIKKEGAEILTRYPRDIESLTIA